jgi:hypothetical protein
MASANAALQCLAYVATLLQGLPPVPLTHSFDPPVDASSGEDAVIEEQDRPSLQRLFDGLVLTNSHHPHAAVRWAFDGVVTSRG